MYLLKLSGPRYQVLVLSVIADSDTEVLAETDVDSDVDALAEADVDSDTDAIC